MKCDLADIVLLHPELLVLGLGLGTEAKIVDLDLEPLGLVNIIDTARCIEIQHRLPANHVHPQPT